MVEPNEKLKESGSIDNKNEIKKKPEEFIKNLDVDSILARSSARFAIYAIEAKLTKKGDKYLNLRLGDKTGVLTALYFTNSEEEVEDSMGKYHVGQIVKVNGIVGKWEGKLNIKIRSPITNSIVPCNENEYDISDFRSVTKGDRDLMLDKIKNCIASFQNPYLKQLCELFFNDEDFIKRFKIAPGAQSKHHNYEGGLLEHTVEIIELGDIVCNFHKELNRDVLFCGIILHDIGKLDSYNFKGASIERTDEEKLIGHIVLGDRITRKKIDEIETFPEELKLTLSHLILSHHGKIQDGYGSVVDPQIPEAYTLYHLDNADSQIKLIIQNI